MDDPAPGHGGLGYIAEPLRALAVPIGSVNLDPANARKHPEPNLQAIMASLKRWGQRFPIVVQRDGMVVRAGNGRVLAARALGWTHVAALVVDESSVEATAFAIADNRTAELAEWDDSTLADLLKSLPKDVRLDAGFTDEDLAALLSTVVDGAGSGEAAGPNLAERFVVPPFSVLDARAGYWQDRKSQWLALGIKSELGRGGAPGGSPRPAARLTASGHTQRGDGVGRALEGVPLA